MPANNRVHSSAALQIHGIWQSAIGYDPYAPTAAAAKDAQSDPRPNSAASTSAGDDDNAYASFQGLLALARITGSNAATSPSSAATSSASRRTWRTMVARTTVLPSRPRPPCLIKIKKGGGKMDEESESNDDDESESSDSDVDPEIERILAAMTGKSKERESGEEKEGEVEVERGPRRGEEEGEEE